MEGEVMEFIKDLWRGDVKLVFTYWVIGVIGNNLFAILDVILGNFFGYYRLTEKNVGNITFLLAATILYFCFTSVCIWRSSVKYEDKNEGSQNWAILARMSVAASAIYILITSTTTIKVIVDSRFLG